MAEFVVITGLGGAGRTHAAHTLEDLGWFVIDNLPSSLLSKVVDLAMAPGSTYDKVALAVGSTGNPEELLTEIRALESTTGPITVLFLQASTESLVNRYESTRRRHPAAGPGMGLAAAVEADRAMMEPLLAAADVVIDTTHLSVHDLARRIGEVLNPAAGQRTRVSVMSFGYSKGLPRDADLVVDCRYLPNPHWVPELRPLTGLDAPVAEYLADQPVMAEALDALLAWLAVVLPAYEAEGRAYLNLAFGCTGGQHRSVAMAEAVGVWLAGRDIPAVVHHRELGR